MLGVEPRSLASEASALSIELQRQARDKRQLAGSWTERSRCGRSPTTTDYSQQAAIAYRAQSVRAQPDTMCRLHLTRTSVFFNHGILGHMRLLKTSLGFWARKIMHITMNGAIAAAAFYVPPFAIPPLTVIGFISILVFESLRLKTRARQFVQDTVGPLFKAEEAVEYSGLFWAGLGALVVAQFAAPPAYSFGFAILAVSDASAAVLGKLSGQKPFYMKKTAVGSCACFVAAFIISLAYASVFPLAFPALVFAATVAGLVTLLEIFSYPFDDNFLILVVASYAFHLAWVSV